MAHRIVPLQRRFDTSFGLGTRLRALMVSDESKNIGFGWGLVCAPACESPRVKPSDMVSFLRWNKGQYHHGLWSRVRAASPRVSHVGNVFLVHIGPEYKYRYQHAHIRTYTPQDLALAMR